MKSYFCSQYDLVEAALRAGHWPEACEPALRAHVENCASCSDLVLVAQTLGQAHRETTQAARLAAPGILWWRAQLHRRRAAIQSVTRPIAVAEQVAVVVLGLVVVALAMWQHNQVLGWLASVWGPLSNLTELPGAMLVGLGSILFFGGFAVYLLTAKE
jgi:hypothetical protein